MLSRNTLFIRFHSQIYIWQRDCIIKGLVQANNSKHFPIDQYLHDRVTPSALSPKPIAYDKLIDPSEMPRISTCMDTMTNVPTKDDKYP